MRRTGVVVIGGDHQGLGVIRSLGRHGIPVYLLDSGACIGTTSKFTIKFFRCPSPEDGNLLLEFLLSLAEEEKLNNWPVYPTDDETVRVLSINKRLLEKYYNISTPDWAVSQILYNKKLTYRLAEKIDIDIPRTAYPKDIGEVSQIDLAFPADPYEPQPGGCLSIFPFFIGNLVELPITLAQDHTLFEILGHKDISIWKQKIDWIEKMDGMALVIVHPDYIRSNGGGRKRGRYPIEHYEELLQYVKNKGAYWHALPREVAEWWRRRDSSEIRFDRNREPYIKGPAAKDGVITWIKLLNDEVIFEVDV